MQDTTIFTRWGPVEAEKMSDSTLAKTPHCTFCGGSGRLGAEPCVGCATPADRLQTLETQVREKLKDHRDRLTVCQIDGPIDGIVANRASIAALEWVLERLKEQS